MKTNLKKLLAIFLALIITCSSASLVLASAKQADNKIESIIYDIIDKKGFELKLNAEIDEKAKDELVQQMPSTGALIILKKIVEKMDLELESTVKVKYEKDKTTNEINGIKLAGKLKLLNFITIKLLYTQDTFLIYIPLLRIKFDLFKIHDVKKAAKEVETEFLNRLFYVLNFYSKDIEAAELNFKVEKITDEKYYGEKFCDYSTKQEALAKAELRELITNDTGIAFTAMTDDQAQNYINTHTGTDAIVNYLMKCGTVIYFDGDEIVDFSIISIDDDSPSFKIKTFNLNEYLNSTDIPITITKISLKAVNPSSLDFVKPVMYFDLTKYILQIG